MLPGRSGKSPVRRAPTEMSKLHEQVEVASDVFKHKVYDFGEFLHATHFRVAIEAVPLHSLSK